MIIFKKAAELTEFIRKQRMNDRVVGFVPTMGALHEGHITLISQSLKDKNLTVCSIFVNPTQFNDPKDFEKYPVTIESDISMLEKAGCEILFLPGFGEIYPAGIQTLKKYELGFIETVLEGKFRPGHFQGVCQVVHRLLEIVTPDFLYMGQKDYQQCMVISKLLELTGLNSRIQLNVIPTIRETDGLAMSSRNRRLNPDDRKNATAIWQCLNDVKENLEPGNTHPIIREATGQLATKGFRVDYVEIADAKTLQAIRNWDGNQKSVALVAAFLNEVRLIDNLLLN
jgi:pantoate--beta-alanine ligase